MNIEKNYDSKKIEQKWYAFWLNKEYFKSNPNEDKNKKAYCILIPPPNVTGKLHIGHALNNTFQDVMIRYKRLQGYNTLWIPGLDAGGIATESVVSRNLSIDKQLKKEDIGRTEFLKLVTEFSETKKSTIINQLKKLGCSCDWSREQFTMSVKLSNHVKKAFKTLYDKNLIYKSNYIINWCTHCRYSNC